MPIATSSDKINLSSEKKTKEFAQKFSIKLKLGNIIFLYGEIGVGKTTFVRYVINELQKQNNLEITEVTSPTFNLLNEYRINEIKINHYDLFRLKKPKEVKDLELFEDRVKSITFIEWPQMIEEKPTNLIELDFKYENDHKKRFVQLKGFSLIF